VELRIKELKIKDNRRLICISDIHGELDLLQQLLDKVGFCSDDELIILGDIFLKGSKPHETLRYVMMLTVRPNVHVVRGNCDFAWGRDVWPDGTDYLDDADKAWLDDLPHIIETDSFVFAHAGLEPGPLNAQNPAYCMRNEAFLENAPEFDKWVVVGHWPVDNYCHQIPSSNPIINKEKRVIAIDGGCVVKGAGGQLNALIYQDNAFSWQYVDNCPKITIAKPQAEKAGTYHATWPSPQAGSTDHMLQLAAGDVVSVIEELDDRYFAKKDGIKGWILKEE